MEEVEVAPPKAYEVRIKILCTSLCHTDLTFWRMKDFPSVFPSILGHEAAGIVESVGEHVDYVAAGDMVVPTFTAHCGECVDCCSERSNVCSRLPHRPGMPRDGSTRFADAAGEPLHNFLSVSSFCEYTVVDVAHLTKIDPAIPPEKACLLSCGISTGVGAAWKVAAVEPDSTVAIFGLGTVGLAVAEGSRLRGATRIIGVDLNPDKFEIGKKFGITDFVNPKESGEKSISDVIKEMTGGGADYCFECIGLASLMSEAFRSSRLVYIYISLSLSLSSVSLLSTSEHINKLTACFGITSIKHEFNPLDLLVDVCLELMQGWGKTIVLGVDMNGSSISIPTVEILRGKSVIGSLFGGIKARTDIPVLVRQYLNKELQLDEFITHELGFSDINKAFDLLEGGKSLRCIIWMDR